MNRTAHEEQDAEEEEDAADFKLTGFEALSGRVNTVNQPPANNSLLAGGGFPLPETEQRFFQSRFGRDLSPISIMTLMKPLRKSVRSMHGLLRKAIIRNTNRPQ